MEETWKSSQNEKKIITSFGASIQSNPRDIFLPFYIFFCKYRGDLLTDCLIITRMSRPGPSSFGEPPDQSIADANKMRSLMYMYETFFSFFFSERGINDNSRVGVGGGAAKR